MRPIGRHIQYLLHRVARIGARLAGTRTSSFSTRDFSISSIRWWRMMILTLRRKSNQQPATSNQQPAKQDIHDKLLSQLALKLCARPDMMTSPFACVSMSMSMSMCGLSCLSCLSWSLALNLMTVTVEVSLQSLPPPFRPGENSVSAACPTPLRDRHEGIKFHARQR
jgi:hypothetical protein